MKTSFPIVDALLLTPKEGQKGKIAICTNSSASGQIYNEIGSNIRPAVSVLGSMIVNRDGAERMIVNSLVHPTLKYLVLFSEETITFSPSTNLLQVLKNGFDASRGGNYIKDGKGAASQYPNLNEKIVDMFRKEIVVLPVFMSSNKQTPQVVKEYLEWLRPKVDKKIYQALQEINSKDKIYYDALNKFIELVAGMPSKPKKTAALNPKDFQHLQLPKIELKEKKIVPNCPFQVAKAGSNIRLDMVVGKESIFIKGGDDFLIGYALMKRLGENKKFLSSRDQLFLGAELGRMKTEITNAIKFPSFIKNRNTKGKKEALLEPNLALKVDSKYYYKVGVKNNYITVACLAYDVCEEVFELRAKSAGALLDKLAEMNRFEEYEMDILHRLDIGTQVGRAAIAAKSGYNFIQDFGTLFKINKKDLPLVVSESDSFLDVHKNVLRKIYTLGLTEEHGDAHKGLARTAVVLGIYRDTEKSLANLPNFYRQGDQTTEQLREEYKKQLLRFDSDGSYSYGQRTRSFFGLDQLENIIKTLKNNPRRAAVIQRFDPARDMMFFRDETGAMKYTHDPCLTHDIFLISKGKLHSFHIARAHNAVNAYPENIFGLYDAYVTTVREKLGLEPGDMYMLSNRANILLLTEEQRAKKILAEPSKPVDNMDSGSGPYELGRNIRLPNKSSGIFYLHQPLKKIIKKPKNKILDSVENYNEVDTLKKAINYLKIKGWMHNNPILCEYQPGVLDPQGDYMPFFQANVFGKKLYATAVFMNHSIKNRSEDIKLCNYMATQFVKTLKCGLGELVIFYIN